jgi:hypothetical protein
MNAANARGSPFQIVGVPTKWAQVALSRGLAILPDSERYKEMRESARRLGWPDVSMKNYALDRDPNETMTVNSATHKITHHSAAPPAQFVNFRENEPVKHFSVKTTPFEPPPSEEEF